MGVTMETPAVNGGSGPIDFVELEPWDSQNDRVQRGGDNVVLGTHDGYWRLPISVKQSFA